MLRHTRIQEEILRTIEQQMIGKTGIVQIEEQKPEQGGQMAWLLVEGDRDLRLMLDNFRIAYAETYVTMPREIKGLAFPEEEEGRIAEMLGWDVPARVIVGTDLKGIYYVKYPGWPKETEDEGDDEEPTQRKGEVRILDHQNMEALHEIQPILETWAKKLGVTIEVWNAHRRQCAEGVDTVERPNVLQIVFYTSFDPAAIHEHETHYRAFGRDTGDGQRDGVRPVSTGGTLIIDAEGYQLGEFHQNTLAVFFDLPHVRKNAAYLMDQFMVVISGMVEITDAKTREEREARKAKEEEELLSKSRDAYVKAVMKRLEAKKAEDEKAIKALAVQLDTLSQQMVEISRKQQETADRLHIAKEVAKDYEKRAGEEYEKLKTLPHVTKVLVAKDIVSVYTDTIFLEFEKNTYEMGNYRIDMHLNGTLTISNLRVAELTGQTQFHHPHVFSYRKPEIGDNVCLGNIRDGVMRLIGQYEYAVAAQILIDFLHTVTNASSYPTYLKQHWKPMKKDEDGKKKATATATAKAVRAAVA